MYKVKKKSYYGKHSQLSYTSLDNSSIIQDVHLRNLPYFERMFLWLNYIDVTKRTYIRSWTVV
jgi:hypothetical protein